MTGNKKLFLKLFESDYGEVKVGDGKGYKISGVGELEFKTKQGKVEKMSAVYYGPDLKNNLLSVGHLLKKGYDIHFREIACYLSKKNQVVAKVGVASNNLFSLTLQNENMSCFIGIDKGVSKLSHDRYDHLNYGNLEMLSKKMMVKGLPNIVRLDGVCEACQLGKQHKTLFPSKSS
mgnify:CR=1 FL=1